ncbi:hypothetical protein [Curtobacterium sp. MCBA15_004]|uniref:hypothetical protein n=1 Tax=Curtobacterium sp. MCBA15_004 TaxID=1898733 RepID=UPI0008DE401B|nr:hypothetical protein [Curtobacterium sp. MCBA15_004]WIA95810.1 hypothetical protein QOL16_11890 [Curtobacterium sp. MCBA15_004]
MATRLDLNYDVQQEALRKQMTLYVLGMFVALDNYRDVDAAKFVTQVVPRIESGQRQMAMLTDAYMARSVGQLLAQAAVRGIASYATTLALRGIAGEQVFQRPFASVHSELAKGATMTTAVNAGRDRLRSLVTTGLQLSKTHAANRAMERAGIEQYQRVLTGRENCSLCVIASTQRYRVGRLMPIHPGCDCGVRPLPGGSDEQVINPTRLESIHSAITAEFGDTDRAARYIDGGKESGDYTDLLVTYEHSELGPTLAWRDQHHTVLTP